MDVLDVSDVGLSRRDRFEWFRDTVSDELMPFSMDTGDRTNFRARITDLELGATRVSTFTFSPVTSRRTAADIRRGDPEDYQLAWVRRGSLKISQRDVRSVITGAGDFALTSSSMPLKNDGSSPDGLASVSVLKIPRSALALRPERVDSLLAQPIRGDRGTAAVFRSFLSTLLAQGATCQRPELAAMESIAVDLATACLAQQLGRPQDAPAEARAQEMLQRIIRFVDTNLGDSELTPRAVADHHNISLRTLYNLFQDQPMSVAARIRHGRLEGARQALERPESSGRAVQTVALRWGFTSATGFSRAFREAYGVTPTEHRAAALVARPEGG
ncbi:helix-turn-helix domain-containing protein [Streptomyces sp. NPDC093225]|uniref:AraC-like ligand-binding domain-containing protein n=1 Tax=Streptomyces sp. NPDC093225 TaxID=3366034 RepID=UPI00380BD402